MRFGRAGRLSWPLLALVLLLIGLLGAALATRITNADGPAQDRTQLVASVAHYPRADAPDGMITDNGSAAFAANPASTEAKDA